MTYYKPSDRADAEERAARSYAAVWIGLAIVLFVLLAFWFAWAVKPEVHKWQRPQTHVIEQPAAVIITEPNVDKIQDKVEAQVVPQPAPESPALKGPVDLPPDATPGTEPGIEAGTIPAIAEPGPVIEPAPAPEPAPVGTADPGWTCGPYGCSNDAAVAAQDKAQREEAQMRADAPRHRRHHIADAGKMVRPIGPRRRMSPGLRRVLSEGAGQVADRCQGDCSFAAMFCKMTARGAGLIR